MQTLIIFYIILLGLVIGCFLNVCICRIPNKQSIISPPSHCTSCGTRLKPLDLVPVFSYIYLKGRCRYCGNKVSARYPIVEGLTAVVFVLMYLKYSLTAEFAAMAFLSCILICITFIDVEYKIIPNEFIVAGLIGGLFLFGYNLFYQVEMFGDRAWYNPLLGLICGSGFLLMVAFLGTRVYKNDDAMGMGDIKLLAVVGVFLGWRLTIISLMAAVFTAAFASLLFILLKKKSVRSVIAFGPFIAMGTVVAAIWGSELLDFYIGLFIR